MAATFGERRGIRIKTSDQRYFEYDQLGIQGTERIDINIHDVGDTSNAGAMIMLSTNSS
jgi:HK97 family phage major capsid protein